MTRPNSSKVIENPNLFCKVDHSKHVRGILIHYLNVGSLMSHLDEVKLWLDEQKPHIFGLNETRLDNSVTDENIDIEGYSVLRKDRNRFGGGCAIYIDNNITFKRREDLDDDLESVSIELLFPYIKPIIYTCLYCLTKISIRTKHSISRVFSLFIVPSPFFVHCPYKVRINRAKSVLTTIYGFCHCF